MKNYYRTFSLILFSLLYVYIILRAILVPMAHDEVATFFHFVHTGHFLPHQAIQDANNHLLNSFLTWIFYTITGSPLPLTLRLSNLIFFPLFFYFLFKTGNSQVDTPDILKYESLFFRFFCTFQGIWNVNGSITCRYILFVPHC